MVALFEFALLAAGLALGLAMVPAVEHLSSSPEIGSRSGSGRLGQ